VSGQEAGHPASHHYRLLPLLPWFQSHVRFESRVAPQGGYKCRVSHPLSR
jgi:hypothetical protein